MKPSPYPCAADAKAELFAQPLVVGYVGQVVNPLFRQRQHNSQPAADTSRMDATPVHTPPSSHGEERPGGEILESPSEEVRGCITLIARMEVARSGTMLWRKGLDLKVGQGAGPRTTHAINATSSEDFCLNCSLSFQKGQQCTHF